MMVIDPTESPAFIRHDCFSSFPERLGRDDLLVLNDTRVFPARLLARPKPRMTRPIEILLTRQRDALEWEAWSKPARRLRAGDRLVFSDELTAEVVAKEEGRVRLVFSIAGGEPQFRRELERIGEAPLPPYIHAGPGREEALETYQTVYADEPGAVAAPTAGLHFSREILDRIVERGTEIVRLTLHVGPGTFKPVEVEEIGEHRMDTELYRITEDAAIRLNHAIETGRRIVAVGTTSVRALEAAAREGEGLIAAGERETDLFITPGFEFRVVDAMLTNFHLPESTLLMLVSAFAGIDTIRRGYREAIEQGYLFYSFGDCMFITERVR